MSDRINQNTTTVEEMLMSSVDFVAGVPGFFWRDPKKGIYQFKDGIFSLKELNDRKEQAITSFDGPYRFLSNFWPCTVLFSGFEFRSVENAYQAAKSMDQEERAEFVNLIPREAKKRGRKVDLRSDWNEVRVKIMRSLLLEKFSDPDLRKKLLKTNSRYLIEGNTWGDIFWGVCNGRGENQLGKLLMQVRQEIKQES